MKRAAASPGFVLLVPSGQGHRDRLIGGGHGRPRPLGRFAETQHPEDRRGRVHRADRRGVEGAWPHSDDVMPAARQAPMIRPMASSTAASDSLNSSAQIAVGH